MTYFPMFPDASLSSNPDCFLPTEDETRIDPVAASSVSQTMVNPVSERLVTVTFFGSMEEDARVCPRERDSKTNPTTAISTMTSKMPRKVGILRWLYIHHIVAILSVVLVYPV